MANGKAGPPLGNQNNAKGREATKALMQALAIASELKDEDAVLSKYKALVDIWKKQIELAKEGSHASANMIVERLEGKPKQAVVGGDEDDAPIRIQRIELVPLSDDNSS